MSDLESRLKDPKYANWVKNALALEIANEVLKPYVVQQISTKHTSLKEFVLKRTSGATCGLCEMKDVESCPNNVCDVIKREIKSRHRFSKPSFNITDPKQWEDDSWEIAKCFLPPILRNQDCTPSDADFSAIMSIIINDKHFNGHVSCNLGQSGNLFHKAREMRNKVMHSSVHDVDETDLQNNIDLLINMLNDFNVPLPNSPKAVQKLGELKTGKLEITLQNEKDAHEQAVLAYWEEVHKGKEEIKENVELAIQKIERSFNQKALRHRANFINGCKHSLIKLAKSHIDNQKPEQYTQDQWTLSVFLDKIVLFPDIAMLPDRHNRMLYPDLGEAQDVGNWDLFLLCHILLIEKAIPLPNNQVNYITQLKLRRDKILDNPADSELTSLEELTQYLDEPLKREVEDIFMDSSETSNEDPHQLQHILQSWRHSDEIIDSNKKANQAYINERKQQVEQIEEVLRTQKQLLQQMEEVYKKLGMPTPAVSRAEGVNESVGTDIEIRPNHCSREEKEKLQNNILAEDAGENIAYMHDGINRFRKELNLESVQPAKGSILLKVTCKSLKDLIVFWDSCFDGRAVKALSKMRDDYRKFLGCDTLDFDIVLTRKEVDRCMNQIDKGLSSQLLDETFREAKDMVAMFETVTGDVAEFLSRGTRKPGLNEDRPVKTDVRRTEEETTEWSEIPKETSEDLKEEYISGDDERQISDTDKQVKTDVQRTEEETTEWSKIPKETSEDLKVEYISGDDERQISDTDKQGPSGQVTVKKGSKYSQEDATRLVKFLEEIAENFEEGKISVIKPYLENLIKYSKDRNKKEFEEVIMDFTEATKFRSGISVTLLKQTYRGFRMILTEPEFGDLVAAKVEDIEKQEELKGGVESKAWQIDPKILAEDIQVGDKIAKEPGKTSEKGYGKQDEGAGTSKGFGYHMTEEDVSSESKLSPIQGFKKDVSSSKVESLKMKSTELAMEEDKPKSMELMSFKRKPGSPGSLEATETSPAPKS